MYNDVYTVGIAAASNTADATVVIDAVGTVDTTSMADAAGMTDTVDDVRRG
jgi:hypothetical protein